MQDLGDSGRSGQAAEEQLAAVRLLLSAGDRHRDAHDVILATAFEVLLSGPKTTDEIVAAVTRTWPGVDLRRAAFEVALAAAETAGYIGQTHAFQGVQQWALLDLGEQDVARSQEWARDVIARFRGQVRAVALEDLGDAKDADVDLWTSILLDGLTEGIGRAIVDDPGSLVVSGTRLAVPSHYELDPIFEWVDERVRSDPTRLLLKSIVIASMDPAAECGSEVVHHIAVGYLLHNYLARQDLAGAIDLVGTLRGQVVVLDTPLLLQMLDRSTSSAISDGIAHATSVGVRVILLRDTTAEFSRLLERHENVEVREVESALAGGADLDALRSTQPGDVVRAWLSHGGSPDGRPIPWADFRKRAGSLSTTMKALGAEVDVEVNFDFQASAAFSAYEHRLRDLLAERGGGRGPEAIKHDARLLTFVGQARSASEGSPWPGGLVISTDTYLNDTYEPRRGVNAFPVCLSFGQYLSLLSTTSSVEDAEKIVELTSVAISAETRLMRGVRVPADVALAYATSMAPGTPAEAAVEAGKLQLSLESLLREQPDLAIGDEATQQKVATELIARRVRRQTEAGRGQHAHAQAALRAEREQDAADRARLTERARVQEERAMRAERGESRAKSESTRLRRSLVALCIGAPLLVAFVALVVAGELEGNAMWASIVGLAVYLGLSLDYVGDPQRSLASVIGVAIFEMGLVVGGAIIFGH